MTAGAAGRVAALRHAHGEPFADLAAAAPELRPDDTAELVHRHLVPAGVTYSVLVVVGGRPASHGAEHRRAAQRTSVRGCDVGVRLHRRLLVAVRPLRAAARRRWRRS